MQVVGWWDIEACRDRGQRNAHSALPFFWEVTGGWGRDPGEGQDLDPVSVYVWFVGVPVPNLGVHDAIVDLSA